MTVTEDDIKSLQLMQIIPENVDEYALWTKCKDVENQNQLMVPWNFFFTVMKTFLSNNENMKKY